MFNKIKDHVFEQIDDCQHGFVPRKSCVTQLIEVFEHIGREVDLRKQVDVIYLDMSKAFDRVSHMQLLKRLRDFGFGGSILNLDLISRTVGKRLQYLVQHHQHYQ